MCAEGRGHEEQITSGEGRCSERNASVTRQKNLILLLFFALAFVCGAISVYLILSYNHVMFWVIIAVIAAI